MATFVFVSGGWHGGWCWKRVTDHLAARGHESLRPTLTGLGDRAHLAGPSVDLETHITDVRALLEWEDLHDVVLVGHSYGGMVVTGVADRVPERLVSVVYFDALWPQDGEATRDLIGHDAAATVEAAGVDPERPPSILGGRDLAVMLGVEDPDDAEWVARRLTPQPPGTLSQPLRCSDERRVPVVYVRCTDSAPTEGGLAISWERARARAETDPGVRVVDLDAPHDAMITHPRESADLLASVADSIGAVT